MDRLQSFQLPGCVAHTSEDDTCKLKNRESNLMEVKKLQRNVCLDLLSDFLTLNMVPWS